jgi:hypothetical protein
VWGTIVGRVITLIDLVGDHVEDFCFGEVAATVLAASDAVYGSSDRTRLHVTWGFWSGDGLGVVDGREGGAQGSHGSAIALLHRVGEGAAQASPQWLFIGHQRTVEVASRSKCRGFEVEGNVVVPREQPRGAGLDHRGLVPIAGEGTYCCKRIEAREDDERRFRPVDSMKNFGSQESRDRAHRWEQLTEQEAFVRPGINGRRPSSPHPCDHRLSNVRTHPRAALLVL